MALLDLWLSDRTQLAEKHVQQVIAFAGDGKLRDGSTASAELRDYLRNIPSALLSRYADNCLTTSFTDSGLALQDIVNEVGRRLGFLVTHGRYRGAANHPGHDGLWSDAKPHTIVIEVKTTDAYRIDLGTVAAYRRTLGKDGILQLETSSMLIVVGRQDTGDLEAQIRGSRHAWDMRVISVDALLRLLNLRESVEDPSLLGRIHDILAPHEFTRLDPIIDIAFAAVSDVVGADEDDDENTLPKGKKFTPVAFHDACMTRVEQKLGLGLVKRSRASWASAGGRIAVMCAVSRFHERANAYWFAFHPYQEEFLLSAEQCFVAFGCGGPDTVFLIPFPDFQPWLQGFSTTEQQDRLYWHVKIRPTGSTHVMLGKAGTPDHDLANFRV